jgi:hypothetical protein
MSWLVWRAASIYESAPRSDLHCEEDGRPQDFPAQRQELRQAHPAQIDFSLLAKYCSASLRVWERLPGW